MDPERPTRDDFDVRLEWRDAGESELVPLDEPEPVGTRKRAAGSARRAKPGAPPSAESVASALSSLQGVVDGLVQAVADMQRVVEATAAKVDKLQKPGRASGDSPEIRDEIAELARQIELLRKRVSLRARNEQLATETAERIAATVIDSLAEAIPEVGPRLRSRRRTARS